MGKWEICWKIQEFVLELLLYKGLIKANLKLLGKQDSLIATYIEDLIYWDGWSAPLLNIFQIYCRQLYLPQPFSKLLKAH